jgi:pyruvate formate lyase activating enzyme
MAAAAMAGAMLPLAGAATTIETALAPQLAGATPNPDSDLPEVAFYDKLDNKKIQCKICPRECKVGDRERGFCGNKENHGGKYYTLVMNKACSMNNDPIEKKPLFHFLPGTTAFSLSAAGCNFDCKFCQNWEISQSRPEQVQSYDLPPDQVAAAAKQYGSRSIAFTYGEPVVYYEYMAACAKAALKNGVRGVMITNGYINPAPMRAACKLLDAVKIDFKAFTDGFYSKQCLGRLKPVLDTIVLLKREKMWLELVTLVVPGLNDKPKEFKDMAKWIADNAGPDVPIHFSRFHPEYKLKNLEPTPLSTLETARNTCLEAGLHYVYVGNVPGHAGENTYCPKCGKAVVQRYGYVVQSIDISGGRCKWCRTPIAGVWS